MIRIGFIGLDTSHPARFYKILSDMPEVEVSAVYDTGDVRDTEYVEQFCSDYDCRLCPSPQAMLDHVDAVMVLSVNWDAHLAQAEPFLKAGKPVYVDKPLVGRLSDLRSFIALAESTQTPVLAGSGWRFNDSVFEARRRAVAAGGASSVYVESRVPRFFYGIHAVELLRGILGPGVTRVQTLAWPEQADPAGSLIAAQHRSGATGLIRIAADHFWRGAAYQLDGQWQQVSFEPEEIHDAVCGRFVEMIRTGRSLDEIVDLGESVRVMLAARMSAQQGGQTVAIAQVDDQTHFDGDAFTAHYREYGTTPPVREPAAIAAT